VAFATPESEFDIGGAILEGGALIGAEWMREAAPGLEEAKAREASWEERSLCFGV
jgi:hypothetical protein